MTESEARRKAESRWGAGSFARNDRLNDNRYVGYGIRTGFDRRYVTCGQGRTWEQAFADADARERMGAGPVR